jgi:hypothetical protein
MFISSYQRHFQQLTSPFCVCDCTRILKLNDNFPFYVESWAKELMCNPCFPTSKVAFHLVTQQPYQKSPMYYEGQQYNPNWLQHMGNNNTIAIHIPKQSNIHIHELLLVINHCFINNITTFNLMTIIIFNAWEVLL